MEMFQIIYSLTSGLQTIRRNFFHRNCFTIQRPCGMVKGICIVLFPTTHREAISHFFYNPFIYRKLANVADQQLYIQKRDKVQAW